MSRVNELSVLNKNSDNTDEKSAGSPFLSKSPGFIPLKAAIKNVKTLSYNSYLTVNPHFGSLMDEDAKPIDKQQRSKPIDKQPSIPTPDYLNGLILNNKSDAVFKLFNLRPTEMIAGIDRKDTASGQTVLMKACEKADVRLVEFLLKYNADPNITDNKDETATIIATDKNSIDIIKMLMEYKANINHKSIYSNSPLIIAGYHDYMPIVKLLVSAGCDLDIKESNYNHDKFKFSSEFVLYINDKKQIEADQHRYNKEPMLRDRYQICVCI